MMYSVRYTKKFEKSVKLCVKRGLDLELLRSVITILAREGNLPVQYKPHKLSGKYSGLWECPHKKRLVACVEPKRHGIDSTFR